MKPVEFRFYGLFCGVIYQVYIIRNPQGRHYIGLSESIETRLDQHNSGQSRWTKGKGPWHLVWTSATMALGDARKLENLLKRQKGGSGLYELTGMPRPESP